MSNDQSVWWGFENLKLFGDVPTGISATHMNAFIIQCWQIRNTQGTGPRAFCMPWKWIESQREAQKLLIKYGLMIKKSMWRNTCGQVLFVVQRFVITVRNRLWKRRIKDGIEEGTIVFSVKTEMFHGRKGIRMWWLHPTSCVSVALRNCPVFTEVMDKLCQRLTLLWSLSSFHPLV